MELCLENQQKTVRRGYWKKIWILSLCLLAAAAFLPTAKVEAAVNGFRVQNGAGYYYKNGVKQTGWINLSGKKYYFQSNGKQLVGWQKDSYGKNIRFFYNKPGAEGYMATGFMKDNKKNYYYFNPKNGMITRGWLEIDGRYRYFNSKTGIMNLGLRKVGSKYYYFITSNSTALLGARSTMGFATINDKKYYFNKKDGHAQTGWMTLSGKKYHFSNEGVMYTGIKKVGEYWYYFGNDGIMSTAGIKKLGSNTYYFHPSTGRAQVGWLTLNGKKYYFSSLGKRYENTTFTVNGVAYQANASGVVSKKTYNVTNHSTYGVAHDAKNGRDYYVAREYFTHPGVANGTKTDRDLLAAIVECEAGDQGLVGMEAVALCILNRTIKSDKEFPSEVRYVLYQVQYPSSYPQYSPVRYGNMLQSRLNGNFNNKTLAYQAADGALKIFNDYVTKKTPRYLKGFDRKDFNFMYFMSPQSFWGANLNFNRVDYYWYKVYNSSTRDHMFFVDWV